MKLRIRGNSLRLRLAQRDLEQLAAEGRVEDALRVGPEQSLRYVLAQGEGAPLALAIDGTTITVTINGAELRRLATTDEIGVEYAQPGTGGELVRIAVEKDLACRMPRAGEEDEGAFPNSLGEHGASDDDD